MNLFDLRYKIEKSWTRESSFCPEEWSETNPAIGQCAVSSLLLHEILKLNGHKYCFQLIKCKVNDRLHYYNEINGVPFDITWKQFPTGAIITDIEDCEEAELIDRKWKIDCFLALKDSFNELKFSKT